MLVAKQLGKSFKVNRKNEQWGVKNLNLVAKPGDVIALLGRNGAGKSTLMRLLAGIYQPSEGSVNLTGPANGQVQLLTPADNLYQKLTVLETLHYFCDLYEIQKNNIEPTINDVTQRFNLTSFLNKKVGELSTGMKQRVSLAKAFLVDPQVIMLDEPTAGLDIESSYKLIEIIQNLSGLGKIIIVSTHNMSEVKQIANRVLMLEQGQLIYDKPLFDFEANGDSLEASYMKTLEAA
ncbi:sodium ABC transporter ATP-binding protein NatA [Alteromonas sp. D210916BOD_24]|uniref:ABC transporter ATP-binding protein n=1 Tax=Alteromonas sp. D210916BOD_24 TaxID=3157618 RepID=UPI00399CA76F